MNNYKLKQLLDSLYNKYNKQYSDNDPVWLLHGLQDIKDIEFLGFIVSCYAYGRVEQIIFHTKKFLKSIGGNVYEFIFNFNKKRDSKYCKGFYYRFNTDEDFLELVLVLNKLINKYKDLKSLFIRTYNPAKENIYDALNFFSKTINSFSLKNGSFRYLIPVPENNSTCKRLNLFLRWMVRKDNVDLGIWGKEISKSKLIIPVDTHVYRQAQRLKLIDRKSCDMKFALKLTDKLKTFDPNDPVKYDFSLCHLGMQ